MWRIFGFSLSEIHPSVRMLTVHLPDQQTVLYREDENLTEVAEKESAKMSMLLAYFEKNRQSENARQYLYKDLTMHFTWDAKKMQWNDRQRGGEVGRLVSANPAEGERYYLRVLLTHVKGPTCFEDLLTVDGVQHRTFRKAALERGLIETDDSLSECLLWPPSFSFPAHLEGYLRLFWFFVSLEMFPSYGMITMRRCLKTIDEHAEVLNESSSWSSRTSNIFYNPWVRISKTLICQN